MVKSKPLVWAVGTLAVTAIGVLFWATKWKAERADLIQAIPTFLPTPHSYSRDFLDSRNSGIPKIISGEENFWENLPALLGGHQPTPAVAEEEDIFPAGGYKPRFSSTFVAAVPPSGSGGSGSSSGSGSPPLGQNPPAAAPVSPPGPPAADTPAAPEMPGSLPEPAPQPPPSNAGEPGSPPGGSETPPEGIEVVIPITNPLNGEPLVELAVRENLIPTSIDLNVGEIISLNFLSFDEGEEGGDQADRDERQIILSVEGDDVVLNHSEQIALLDGASSTDGEEGSIWEPIEIKFQVNAETRNVELQLPGILRENFNVQLSILGESFEDLVVLDPEEELLQINLPL